MSDYVTGCLITCLLFFGRKHSGCLVCGFNSRQPDFANFRYRFQTASLRAQTASLRASEFRLRVKLFKDNRVITIARLGIPLKDRTIGHGEPLVDLSRLSTTDSAQACDALRVTMIAIIFAIAPTEWHRYVLLAIPTYKSLVEFEGNRGPIPQAHFQGRNGG